MNLSAIGRRTGSIILLVFCPVLLSAQKMDSAGRGMFKQRDFGRYCVSDMYSPETKIQLGFATNSADYNNDPKRTSRNILVEEFTLGTDVPFYTGTIHLLHNDLRLSVNTSFSANVWFDFLGHQSEPILNVDYRLGLPELYLLKELNGRRLKNVLLRLAILQHESTHIGDELALFRKQSGFPITRINVSYESGEVSLTLNDPTALTRSNHSLTVGGKFMYVIGKRNGYYTMSLRDGDPDAFVPSVRRLEGYLRYQYDGLSGPLQIAHFYPVISAELRGRIKFGYSYYVPDPLPSLGYTAITEPEKYVPCLNVYAGWRHRGVPGSTGRVGGYLHYYNGINPHGQFRNIPGYSFLGVAFVYQI